MRFRWPRADKFQAMMLKMIRIHGKFNANYLREVLPELGEKSNRELSFHIKGYKQRNCEFKSRYNEELAKQVEYLARR